MEADRGHGGGDRPQVSENFVVPREADAGPGQLGQAEQGKGALGHPLHQPEPTGSNYVIKQRTVVIIEEG